LTAAQTRQRQREDTSSLLLRVEGVGDDVIGVGEATAVQDEVADVSTVIAAAR
jgi:hypothetical protein